MDKKRNIGQEIIDGIKAIKKGEGKKFKMKWKDYKKELLQNPKVKKEYENLKPKFELAKSFIQAKIKQKMTQ